MFKCSMFSVSKNVLMFNPYSGAWLLPLKGLCCPGDIEGFVGPELMSLSFFNNSLQFGFWLLKLCLEITNVLKLRPAQCGRWFNGMLLMANVLCCKLFLALLRAPVVANYTHRSKLNRIQWAFVVHCWQQTSHLRENGIPMLPKCK